MAEVLTDERIAQVLRPYVRATGPILRSLAESDPLRLRRRLRELDPAQRPSPHGRVSRLLHRLDAMRLPGSSAWDAMDPAQRTDWWVQRVGGVIALLTAVPGLAGALSDRLPIQNALGTAGQGLLLCAIAGEYGLTDHADQVQLLASVLFSRKIPREIAQGSAEDDEAERARAEEILGDLHDLDHTEPRTGRRPLAAVFRALWRMARALWEIDSELDKRPQGRLYHRAIGMLPVVGMAGDFLGERSALRRVAKRGTRWIHRQHLAR